MNKPYLKTSFYGTNSSHLFVRIKDLRMGIRFAWLRACVITLVLRQPEVEHISPVLLTKLSRML
jgi:hypothetical protein